MPNRYDREEDRERLWRQSEEERRRRPSSREGGQERGFFDRAGDEMRSWFGDDEAERRRRQDEQRYGRERGYYRGDDDPSSSRRYQSGDENPPTGRRSYSGGQSQYGGGSEYERQGGQYEYGQGGMGYGSQSNPYRGQYRSGQGYESQSYRPPYTTSYSYTELWMVPGPYTGRGPQGYQRSDDRIREDICERLMQHGLIDASQIQVEVHQGDVILKGNANDRNTKRRVEETAESVSGVKEVQNQIRVNQEQAPPGQWSESGQSG